VKRLRVGLLGLGLFSAATADAHSSAPVRKPGYWDVSATSDRFALPRTRRMCVGAALFRPRSPTCATYEVRRVKDAWVFDMDCRSARGARVILHSVTTGNLASKYSTSADFRVSGAAEPARNGHHAVVVSWTYRGACPETASPQRSALPFD
jgi:hypothetical protein